MYSTLRRPEYLDPREIVAVNYTDNLLHYLREAVSELVGFDTTDGFTTPAKTLQEGVGDRDALLEATLKKDELLVELNKTEVVGAVEIRVLD